MDDLLIVLAAVLILAGALMGARWLQVWIDTLVPSLEHLKFGTICGVAFFAASIAYASSGYWYEQESPSAEELAWADEQNQADAGCRAFICEDLRNGVRRDIAPQCVSIAANEFSAWEPSTLFPVTQERVALDLELNCSSIGEQTKPLSVDGLRPVVPSSSH